MNFKKIKRISSVILSAMLVFGTQTVALVSAAEDNIEIILEDVTGEVLKDAGGNDLLTLKGEAKIKVSVKGAGGNVSAVQTALEFDEKLKYKSIDFLIGENNPPQCALIAPNAALANTTRKLLPSIVTNNSGRLALTDEKTALFVLTFAGEPGDSVTVSLDDESAAGSYVIVDNNFVETQDGAVAQQTATASDEDNEGVKASVKLIMDKVDDFQVSDGEGYADSKLTLTITNEKTGSTISTVLNTVLSTKGGHYYDDGTSSVPVFLVENTVVDGASYTVELKGDGYVTYKRTGVIFNNNQPLEIRNENSATGDNFVPGDVNMDGRVDMADKLIYQAIIDGESGECKDFNLDGKLESEETEVETENGTELVIGADLLIFRDILSGSYDDYADFNRSGKVDGYDDVFENIEADTRTAPAKMAKPTVTGGDNKITLSWTAPADGGAEISGYTIKYGTSAGALNQTVEASKTPTTKEITGLSAGTTYYVQIAAKNEIGTGAYSDTAAAVTNSSGDGEGGGDFGGGSSGGSSGGGAAPSTPSENTQITPATPATPSGSFADLANYLWAQDSIYALKEKGIISGVSATEYAPASNIKRGDFILILTRMLSINDTFTQNFADVPATSYYYNAIGSARAAGIAQGSGESFMPENTITRQDLITLAYRAFLAKGYITEAEDMTALDVFNDKASISDYAQAPMASMVSAGIIKGSDGNVNPLGYATRAEVAVMCARLLALMN